MKRTVFMLFILLIFFGSIEIFFRVIKPDFYQDLTFEGRLLVGNLRLIQCLQPNFYGKEKYWGYQDVDKTQKVEGAFHVRINSKGYRGPEFEWEKPLGVFRIACIGDSVTFGIPVDDEDTYPGKLGAILNYLHPMKRFEVLNLGVPGYTSEQGRIMVNDVMMKLNPDVALIGFGYNDSFHWVETDRERLAREHTASRKIQRLMNRLHMYRAMRAVVYKAQGLQIVGDRLNYADPSRQFERRDQLRVPPDEFKENMRYILNRCRETGIQPVLLITEFPRKYSVSMLCEISSQMNVPLIDFHAAFEKYVIENQKPMQYVMSEYIHPNAYGTRIMAEVLSESILELESTRTYLEKPTADHWLDVIR
jgi:lysophospholipase L1-like esterase